MQAGDDAEPGLLAQGIGSVEGVTVDDVAEAAVDLRPNAVRVADDGESMQHGVVDQVGHRGPVAAHGQLVQVGVQVGPAVQVEHGAVGGGGAVEGELFADGGHRDLEVGVGVAGGDQPRVADAEPVAAAA